MKILLHICCAPCSIHPFKELLKGGDHQITGFYFNPNIHPYQEYVNRRSALEEYSRAAGLPVVFPGYEPHVFFRKVAYHEQAPMRCRSCWQMRLEAAAQYAARNGFDAFTTTLLISPYQDHLVVKEIGEGLASRSGVPFYYRDFRTGFRESQDEARRHNLYRQNYCGCIYSEIERFRDTQATRKIRNPKLKILNKC